MNYGLSLVLMNCLEKQLLSFLETSYEDVYDQKDTEMTKLQKKTISYFDDKLLLVQAIFHMFIYYNFIVMMESQKIKT